LPVSNSEAEDVIFHDDFQNFQEEICGEVCRYFIFVGDEKIMEDMPMFASMFVYIDFASAVKRRALFGRLSFFNFLDKSG